MKGIEMSKDYSYGWEKLYSAVRCLSGKGDQRSRLANAVTALHTLHIRPEEHHLPDDIQTEFNEFFEEMTSQEAIGDEGRIKATVNSLDETEISQAVEKIIDFYDIVCRYQEPY
jgi:hypothetical protein